MQDPYETVTYLASLEPGKLPLDVFNQFARLMVTPVVEVVPFYKGIDKPLRVYLLKRSADDPLWPNMYHVPGSTVLSNDTPGSFADALQRALSNRLVALEPFNLTHIETRLCRVSRGLEVAIVYSTELKLPPEENSLYSFEALPENIIEGHEDFIKIAFKKFG